MIKSPAGRPSAATARAQRHRRVAPVGQLGGARDTLSPPGGASSGRRGPGGRAAVSRHHDGVETGQRRAGGPVPRRCGADSRRLTTRSVRAVTRTLRGRLRNETTTSSAKCPVRGGRRAGELYRLGQDGGAPHPVTGGVENDRAGATPPRTSALDAVQGCLSSILHATESRPGSPQRRMGQKLRAQGTAVRAGRKAGGVDGLGGRGGGSSAASGGMENRGSGAPESRRRGLAAFSDRVSPCSRALRPERPGGACSQPGRARGAVSAARGDAGVWG